MKNLELEGVKREYKEVIPPPKSLAHLIASFVNTEGGKVVFGVKDDLTLVGLSDNVPVRTIVETALSYLRPKPVVNGYFSNINGKQVYILEIKDNQGPVITEDGRFYVRDNTTIRLANQDDLHRNISQVRENHVWYTKWLCCKK